MPKLRRVSGLEAIRALEWLGFEQVRQRGSHVVMLKPGCNASLSVPQHREIAPGTLRALIRSAGMTVDEFVTLL